MIDLRLGRQRDSVLERLAMGFARGRDFGAHTLGARRSRAQRGLSSGVVGCHVGSAHDARPSDRVGIRVG